MLNDPALGQYIALAVIGLLVLRAVLWLRRRGIVGLVTGRPQVIDGDSLIVQGSRIRIAGIDAPERGQRFIGQIIGRGPGTLASAELRRVIAGKELDVAPIKRDRYGRLVSVVRADGEDVGATMIARGYAVAFMNSDRRYAELEAEARAAGRGLWKREFARPEAFRQYRRSRGFLPRGRLR